MMRYHVFLDTGRQRVCLVVQTVQGEARSWQALCWSVRNGGWARRSSAGCVSITCLVTEGLGGCSCCEERSRQRRSARVRRLLQGLGSILHARTHGNFLSSIFREWHDFSWWFWSVSLMCVANNVQWVQKVTIFVRGHSVQICVSFDDTPAGPSSPVPPPF